jgi:hypothetical protein
LNRKHLKNFKKQKIIKTEKTFEKNMHQKKYSYRSGAGCRPRQGLELTEALPRGWTSPAPPLHPGAAR